MESPFPEKIQQTNQQLLRKLRDLLVLANLHMCMQCIYISQRYFCICEKALCVVGNELVLVSVQQGFHLQAFGEIMKEFPCCPTAKKKQESRKAGTRRVMRPL